MRNIQSLSLTHFIIWTSTACVWVLCQIALLLTSTNVNAQQALLASVSQLDLHQLPDNTETWIHMQGSNTVGERLTPSIAVDFMRSKGIENISITTGRDQYDKYIKGVNPQTGNYVQIRIESYGSSTGFKGLMKGTADVGASSRPIKMKEVDKLKKLGNMLSKEAEHVIGIDGLAIIVHPSNPINSLTVEQIAQLFSGEITDWSDVGGTPGPVTIHARDNESGTWDTFKNLVLAKKHKLSADAKRYVSNDELSRQVSQDPTAIGFSGLSSVAKSKLLAVADGEGSPAMYPTRLTVGTEDYPLARRLFLYTPPATIKPIVNEFLQFALGEQGQSLVDEIGYVSLNVQQHQLNVADDLPDYYRKAVDGADRLSMNFRFKHGKAQLDNKAYADIQRLVDFMTEEEHKNRSVVLVGASDPRLKNEYAVLLSKLRAKVVRRELIKQGIPRSRILTVANGALMQVAGNESLTQRIKNRRVEVWLQ
ncbi:phosphate ABC transporter substrate-binding/OmpA family protein [Litoribrevibacter albus]|uniref:OmpA-like domain-containing protein n=1 Tax=Litoribrevibacter albus TaxID=1473156 RepID=A0AA37SDA7_9GAMM|nr:phosphate ABC transporter substrate-binding/OmpA family protein [Litoribrevibacter albus]GLQ32941.1 hypothetical protein GCM10007876_34200 [Litoribrevibacter albus]